MIKKNIYYSLQISIYKGDISKYAITIEDLQIQFNIQKSINVLNLINSFTATIFNLNEENRLKLEKSKVMNTINSKKERMIFKAGYSKDDMKILFKGEIETCNSYRENNIIKTEIKAHEISIENSQYISFSYKSSKPNYILQLLNKFKNQNKNIQKVYSSDKAETAYFQTIDKKRPTQYSGNIYNILSHLDENTDNSHKFKFVILDNIASISLRSEKINDNKPKKLNNSYVGILGSPRIMGDFLQVEMLFEPNLNIGENVLFDFSRSENEKYNSVYNDESLSSKLKSSRYVYSLNHSCNVAGNAEDVNITYKYGIDGQCITKAQFYLLPDDIDKLDDYTL